LITGRACRIEIKEAADRYQKKKRKELPRNHVICNTREGEGASSGVNGNAARKRRYHLKTILKVKKERKRGG